MDNKYWLPDEWYNALKWLSVLFMPSLALLTGTIFKTWGLPYADQLVVTINAIGVFIGSLIGLSQLSAMGGE